MNRTHQGFYKKGFTSASHKLKVITKMREMLVKGKNDRKPKKMHDFEPEKLP